MALLLLSVPALGVSLSPPVFLGESGGYNEISLSVTDSLTLHVYEAVPAEQDKLVDAALEAQLFSAAEDPYGVVVWPAGQVCAHSLAQLPLAGKRVLELGAGTGLCALAAAACGATVVAADYRKEPLRLLKRSMKRNSELLGRELDITTLLLDIKSAEPLPTADIVVAADLLYLPCTARALAHRCVESLQKGAELVLIGDCGRPGREPFLKTLDLEMSMAREVASALAENDGDIDKAVKQLERYEDERKGKKGAGGSAQFEFSPMDGWYAGVPRNDMISPSSDEARPVTVGLLKLQAADLSS